MPTAVHCIVKVDLLDSSSKIVFYFFESFRIQKQHIVICNKKKFVLCLSSWANKGERCTSLSNRRSKRLVPLLRCSYLNGSIFTLSA